MSNINVAIINYESGNVHSASKALELALKESKLNGRISITQDPEAILKADRIVLPGVGAFPHVIRNLIQFQD